jgi:hypothetical protein
MEVDGGSPETPPPHTGRGAFPRVRRDTGPVTEQGHALSDPESEDPVVCSIPPHVLRKADNLIVCIQLGGCSTPY